MEQPRECCSPPERYRSLNFCGGQPYREHRVEGCSRGHDRSI